MTQVDFYVVAETSRQSRFDLACRIARKAFDAGKRVLIHAESDEEARHIDRLLWMFEDDGFLPHGRLGACDQDRNPVLIGDGSQAGDEHQVIINLALDVPTFFSRFERLAECVDNEERVRSAARERYKFYRDRGYPLKMHNIT